MTSPFLEFENKLSSSTGRDLVKFSLMMAHTVDKPAPEKTQSSDAAVGKSEKFSELGPFHCCLMPLTV